MIGNEFAPWEHLVVPVEKVLERIKPGASIFLGSAMAEPRTLIKSLLLSGQSNLQDLELIQVVCLGQDFSLSELKSHKFRLKTFYSGWAAGEAVRSGLMDLIPSRFSRIPYLIQSGRIPIEVAFIQISPPNPAGYASLGVAVDVTRQAMEQADLVVGEINPEVPVTFGDTFVPLSDFDLLTSGTEPLFHVPRWPLDKIFDRVAANVAALIEDGNCLNFSVGPLYEGLAKHLSRKRNLGIHSPFFTDALMDLVKSGAVTNRHKGVFRGKSLTTYAVGTPELMAWLNRNPLVEFQSLDKVWDPAQIGRNKRFIAVIPARKVGLGGRIALHFGMMNVLAGPSEVVDMVNGAEMSPGGLTVFALPSRNRKGESNIRLTVGDYPNIFGMRESIDVVATEYGTAFLGGRSLRERAQALIDIAHPDDRQGLVIQAKEHKILYQDQIFLSESAHLYPADMTTSHVFKGGVKVRIRAIKPSDEEEMRRLFYRFSDEAVYYRYFHPHQGHAPLAHAGVRQCGLPPVHVRRGPGRCSGPGAHHRRSQVCQVPGQFRGRYRLCRGRGISGSGHCRFPIQDAGPPGPP